MAYTGDPASWAVAVAASDTVDLPSPTRSIYVGISGNLTVIMIGGHTVTFNSVPVGILPIQVKRVLSTGLTAGALVALW